MTRYAKELLRYILNGLFATIIHFAVLSFNLHVLALSSAGMANFIAAFFGISVSFLGNRYYVFPGTGETFLAQATKFGWLYSAVALLHGLVLLVWTDWIGLDYRIGFLLATGIQLLLSYFGNKFLVFQA